MYMSDGVCYIAYGHHALREADRSIKSLRAVSDLPIALICESVTAYRGIQHVLFEDTSFGARRVKIKLDHLTPFDNTLYLDADTRIQDSVIEKGFDILHGGWDLAIAFSENQGSDLFAHIDREEREYTFEVIENFFPLQLQAGVMWFAKNKRTTGLFDAWRSEWEKFRRQDQAALIRALNKTAVRIWLLGLDWNSRRGAIVDHRFGKAVG